jgi:FkbM family methyltransferase
MDSVIEQRDGWWWPKDDIEAWKWIPIEIAAIPDLVKWVPERNLVIHAGGNCGVWSKIYSPLFKEVVTFEPNDINFECFKRNVDEANVTIYKAGLSDKEGFCKSVDGDGDKNYGALQIEEAEEGIPMMTIDSLNLNPDLIQLDVEGFEENAIRGARNTIMRSRPIIIIEQKKLAKNGMNDAEIAIMIQRMGYFFAERVWSDNVFIPVEKLA